MGGMQKKIVLRLGKFLHDNTVELTTASVVVVMRR
jgi:hypothetical protein